MFPIDVGYPPGTNPLWNITLIGVWLHVPALLILQRNQLPLFPSMLLLFGYLTILLSTMLAWLLFRLVRHVISLR